MIQITPQGITTENLNQIFDRLVAAYKEIYGEDINVSQESADGQRIGIESKEFADIQAAILYLYNSLDIDLAEGEALNRAIKYTGIQRRPATYSTWDINVTTNAETTLYQDYTIQDDAGQKWVRREAITIPVGTTLVTFEARDLGEVSGLISSTLEQSTVIPSVISLAPNSAASLGRDEETDLELKLRRNKSLQNSSYSVVGGLTAKLFNLDGVTDVIVYENDTDIYDATLDLNANSIWAVIEGGLIADIAETLAKQKTAGTGEKGAITGTFLETLPTGRIITHEMKFDRPAYIDVYVNVTATRTGSTPVDTVLIANNLASEAFLIGDAVDAGSLYGAASKDTVGFYLSDLQISDDNTTFTTGQLDQVPGSKYRIQAANVTVTEVIP